LFIKVKDMKIQCDVCDKDEASVFCYADEAALCSACDHRVHQANKLAGQHNRFSLHQPKQPPVCDICQERRAFLFCQQDRAILCRECDISIHKANEHTQKHARFLLTGLQISAALSNSAESPSSNSAESAMKPKKQSNNSISVSTVKSTMSKGKNTTETCGTLNNADQMTSSSISDYLIETLPGWHVDDFLDLDHVNSPSNPYDYYKNGESEKLPIWNADMGSNMSAFSTERMGLWVPQVPTPLYQTHNQLHQSVDICFGSRDGVKEQFDNNNKIKCSRKWSVDNSCAVPQMTPPSGAALKRSRNLW